MNRIVEIMKMEKKMGLNHCEIFKNVAGFVGLYQVSNLGRVKNYRTGRILKPGKDGGGYFVVNFYKNGIVTKHAVHRCVANGFLENPENKKCVDHINRIKTDNNLLNLRFATHSQNSMNKNKQSNNTSGHIGVSWDRNAKKWKVQIRVNGKKKYLGLFDDISIAIEKRKRAEKKFFKEFQKQ